MPVPKKSFFDLFRDNMEGIPLVLSPRSLFDTKANAIKSISAIALLVKAYGTKITIRELIEVGAYRTAIPYLGTATAETLAAAFLEIAMTGAGIYAAYYLGACIGSLAVASGDWLEDGVTRARSDSFPLHVAHNTCMRNGIQFDDCLTSSGNRPRSTLRTTGGRFRN